MLKRMVVRLLMFGIPFSVSYIVTRPAPPAEAARTFVICAYGDHGREIVLATDKSGCEQSDSKPERPANRPGWVVPAGGQSSQPADRSKSTGDILF